MKSQLLLMLLIWCSINGFAQILYEDGCFIDQYGNQVDCKIRDVDWKDNPTSFEYKTSEDGEVKTADIHSVSQFKIFKGAYYKRFTVLIDRSSNHLPALTFQKNAVFNEETLFLKVLIEGDASLYFYEDESIRRFFYTVNGSDVQQLVYKLYLVSQNQMAENRYFQQQLIVNLSYGSNAIHDIENVRYDHRDLVKWFRTYNEYVHADYKDYVGKNTPWVIHLGLQAGVSYNSLSISSATFHTSNTVFEGTFGTLIAAESEFVMPFNKSKLAFFFEPGLQMYKAEKETTKKLLIVDYKSIELPVGIRYYFLMNQRSKWFVDAGFIADFPVSSSINIFPYLELGSFYNGTFGLGYRFGQKYAVSMHYNTNRDLLANFPVWAGISKTIRLSLSYRFF